MTIDNKTSSSNSSQQIGLESFFPLLCKKESATTTIAIPVTIILIRRRSNNSDIWICNSCTWTGDKWFMEIHPCRQNVKNNFAKVAQRLKQQKAEEF